MFSREIRRDLHWTYKLTHLYEQFNLHQSMVRRVLENPSPALVATKAGLNTQCNTTKHCTQLLHLLGVTASIVVRNVAAEVERILHLQYCAQQFQRVDARYNFNTHACNIACILCRGLKKRTRIFVPFIQAVRV